MPIYEYVCRNCGHELERLQRLSEDPLTECPACDTPELKRKISAAGFRLAGGGWYETDFKSDGKRNIASGEDKTSKSSSATSASSSTSDSAKSDTSATSSKPAASDKKSDSAASKSTNKASTTSSSNAGS